MKNLIVYNHGILSLAYLLILILTSCDKTLNPETDFLTFNNSEGTIGKGGGHITINDPNSNLYGASITIPEGAVEENTLVQISQSTDLYNIFDEPEILIISLRPHGIQFTKPIKVTIPYLGSAIEDAIILYYDPDNIDLEIIDPISYDSEKNLISFETLHFSNFCGINLKQWSFYTYNEEYKVKNDIYVFNSSYTYPQYIISMQPENWFGWSYNYWAYSKDLNSGPLGFPHVIYGKNPYDIENPSTTNNLPCDLNTISELYAEFDARFYYKVDPNYTNLVFDIWLTNNISPTTSNITGEIMIWDKKGEIKLPSPNLPGGSLTIDGVEYELKIYEHNKIPGCEVFNFIPKSDQVNTRHRKMDILQFIEYLKDESKIQSDQKYLSSISFGNEIWSGKGFCEIYNYSISIQKKTITPSSTIKDVDGNEYNTISIGSQTWLKENLKVTKYNDGTAIPNVSVASTWTGLTSGAYCDYNNDAINSNTYGRLYNWYAVTNSRNLCPTGWHVPSDAEWKTMEMSIGLTQIQADAFNSWRGSDQGLRMKNTSGWYSEGNGTNTSNFTALPGGQRNGYGQFYELGSWGHWHTSTGTGIDNYRRSLAYNQNGVNRYYTWKHCGYSVRCIRD